MVSVFCICLWLRRFFGKHGSYCSAALKKGQRSHEEDLFCLLHPFFNIAVLSFFYAAGTLVTECVGKSDYAGNVPFVSD